MQPGTAAALVFWRFFDTFASIFFADSAGFTRA
jgi:hypothetical protein